MTWLTADKQGKMLKTRKDGKKKQKQKQER